MEDELRKGKISGYTLNNDTHTRMYIRMYIAIKIALNDAFNDSMPNGMRISVD